jgi:hypothetical protein
MKKGLFAICRKEGVSYRDAPCLNLFCSSSIHFWYAVSISQEEIRTACSPEHSLISLKRQSK